MTALSDRRDERGSAIFLAPLLLVIMAYLTGFFVNLGDAITKADGLDQALSLAAAAASTQISAADYYHYGEVELNPTSARALAVSQIESTLPRGAKLVGNPTVVVQRGSVCVRATERIMMPFTLMPGASPYLTYSTSSSAIAHGSGTSSAPGC